MLGSRHSSGMTRSVSIEAMNHSDTSQMWALRPRVASDPGTFGLQNRQYGLWVQAANLPINIAKSRWKIQLIGHDPWGQYGEKFVSRIREPGRGASGDGEVYVTTNRLEWERWSFSFSDGFRIRSSQFGLHLGARPDGSVYTHSNRLAWERWWAPVVG